MGLTRLDKERKQGYLQGFWPECLGEELRKTSIQSSFTDITFEMLMRYPCSDTELTEGDFEFGLGGKVCTGEINVGIISTWTPLKSWDYLS